MKVYVIALVLCLGICTNGQRGESNFAEEKAEKQDGERPDPAQILAFSAPASIPSHGQRTQNVQFQDFNPKPYAFEYSVNDAPTGNVHSRKESSDSNGVVTGQYQLIQPDGSQRIVDYTADAFSGFRAIVKKIPNAAPPPPQPAPRP